MPGSLTSSISSFTACYATSGERAERSGSAPLSRRTGRHPGSMVHPGPRCPCSSRPLHKARAAGPPGSPCALPRCAFRRPDPLPAACSPCARRRTRSLTRFSVLGRAEIAPTFSEVNSGAWQPHLSEHGIEQPEIASAPARPLLDAMSERMSARAAHEPARRFGGFVSVRPRLGRVACDLVGVSRARLDGPASLRRRVLPGLLRCSPRAFAPPRRLALQSLRGRPRVVSFRSSRGTSPLLTAGRLPTRARRLALTVATCATSSTAGADFTPRWKSAATTSARQGAGLVRVRLVFPYRAPMMIGSSRRRALASRSRDRKEEGEATPPCGLLPACRAYYPVADERDLMRGAH